VVAVTSVAIGTLRWRVILAERSQTPQPEGAGILEAYTELQTVRADVQPLRPMTFYAAQQTDTPVTHMITMRWVPAVDMTHAVLRTTRLREGANRVEVFRVRRIMEIGGRKRFVKIEAELEQNIVE
jgi:head-tail adaptor